METENPPFKVGDRVTTEYTLNSYYDVPNTILRITAIEKDRKYSSGWSVSVDRGDPCPHCGRYFMMFPICGVDSTWFKKVENNIET